ncbi:polysialyltransferase family glycosyltransferase [Marinococcus sp. PL1-022]|uniref:polysialyltransferase family glycosyltransferase n=1 Tax=Marinococcus sp. PL1-022 TaxID=3095363 RepID=UPI0029C13756|nr:polysialyltransferase family glycosyltransferase [Marinococcus sp. PL1-022]MDX6153988.1 polysialyltransferase family glycosyltransferase [Marinococcus sp. PL1-022]
MKTVFSISTVFHLMISKLYIKKHDIKNAEIICYSINSALPKIIKDDQTFDKSLIINRNEKATNRVQIALKNKKNIQIAKKYLQNSKTTNLIVFKDNDIINQALINSAYKNKVKIIMLEEGMGLYKINNNENNYIKQNILKRGLLSYPKYIYQYQGMNSKVDEIMASFPDHLPKEKREKKLISPMGMHEVSAINIESLYDYFNINTINLSKKNFKSCTTILYIGQPFSEFKSLSFQEEKLALENFFNQLFNYGSIKLIIKPHPSERLEKYKRYIENPSVTIIEEYHIPAELIPAKVNVDFVLTGYSSACYYINKWYGIECFSLYKQFFAKSPNQSLSYQMIELFNIKILENFSEIEDIISSQN